MSEHLPRVVTTHVPGLRRYALALTRDPTLAEDLVQEALLIGIEKSASFQSGQSLRAWLFSILHNRFIDARRRTGAEQRRDAAYASVREQPPEADGQELAVLLDEVARRFDRLPENQRAVLHLIAINGLSYQEASTALAVPIGTVMSRLSRARKALRETAAPNRRHLRLVGEAFD